jgi:hypothetical protein
MDVVDDANARELLRVLELPDEELLDLIAHLYQRDDGQALAERGASGLPLPRRRDGRVVSRTGSAAHWGSPSSGIGVVR